MGSSAGLQFYFLWFTIGLLWGDGASGLGEPTPCRGFSLGKTDLVVVAVQGAGGVAFRLTVNACRYKSEQYPKCGCLRRNFDKWGSRLRRAFTMVIPFWEGVPQWPR